MIRLKAFTPRSEPVWASTTSPRSKQIDPRSPPCETWSSDDFLVRQRNWTMSAMVRSASVPENARAPCALPFIAPAARAIRSASGPPSGSSASARSRAARRRNESESDGPSSTSPLAGNTVRRSSNGSNASDSPTSAMIPRTAPSGSKRPTSRSSRRCTGASPGKCSRKRASTPGSRGAPPPM